jgi:hypothetical protein
LNKLKYFKLQLSKKKFRKLRHESSKCFNIFGNLKDEKFKEELK